MSSPLGMELDVMPGDEASLKTNSPRRSLVASLHRKTSHLLGRNPVITNTADNTPLPVHPGPLRSKPSWFHSVGARLQSKRHNHAVIQSSDSSQEIEVELEEGSGMINPPSSPEISPETSRSRSPERRRTFSGRLRLRSLPAKIRRRSAALFRRTSSSNPSDEDKENLSLLETPPAGPVNSPNTGSWSSFRSGVQRAVREMVDGNFCFPEDHGARRPPPPPRSPARVPLRTLWTIMSADSSEGQACATSPPSEQTKSYHLSSPDLSREWSPTSSSRYDAEVSPFNGSGESAEGLTNAGSGPDLSPISTVHSPAENQRASHDSESLPESPVDEENAPELPLRAANRPCKGSWRAVDGEVQGRQFGVELMKENIKAHVVSHPAGSV